MRRLALLLSVVVAVAVAVSGAASPSGSAKGRWVITDLGTLRGMEESEAVAINERGWVVGNSYRNVDSLDRPHAFVWEGTNLVRLGTLGGSLSSASAINADGWIVGWGATRSGARHAFLWRDGRMLDLGTPPGSTNSCGRRDQRAGPGGRHRLHGARQVRAAVRPARVPVAERAHAPPRSSPRWPSEQAGGDQQAWPDRRVERNR